MRKENDKENDKELEKLYEQDAFAQVVSHFVLSAHIQKKQPRLFEEFLYTLNEELSNGLLELHQTITGLLKKISIHKSSHKYGNTFFYSCLDDLASPQGSRASKLQQANDANKNLIEFLEEQPELCRQLLNEETKKLLMETTKSLIDFLIAHTDHSIKQPIPYSLIPATSGPNIYVLDEVKKKVSEWEQKLKEDPELDAAVAAATGGLFAPQKPAMPPPQKPPMPPPPKPPLPPPGS